MQFQEIIARPSRGKSCMCSMSFAGNATSSEKLPKYGKLLIFWQFICQQILPSHPPCCQVAIFPRDGNAIISKTALRSRVKNCSCSLYPLGNIGQALCIRSCNQDLIFTRKSYNSAGTALIQRDSATGSKLIGQTLHVF